MDEVGEDEEEEDKKEEEKEDEEMEVLLLADLQQCWMDSKQRHSITTTAKVQHLWMKMINVTEIWDEEQLNQRYNSRSLFYLTIIATVPFSSLIV